MDTQKENKIIFLPVYLPLFFVSCFIGSMATIYLRGIDLNSIVSSSLISIMIAFAAMVFNDEHHLSWAGFCGAFSGMTANYFLGWNTWYNLLSVEFFFMTALLSGITAFLYVASEYVSIKFPRVFFDGYGGRLGTIAFISVILFILLGVLVKNKIDWSLIIRPVNYNWSDLLVIPSATVAAIISMEIKRVVASLNDNYKVITVGTTGLIGGLLITQIPIYGQMLGLAWYAGAFVGMSSYFILMLRRDYIAAGIVTGIIFLLTKEWFNGFGGKLGFISFLAIIIIRVTGTVLSRIFQFNKPEKVIESLKQGESIDNQMVDDQYAEKLVASLKEAQNQGVSIQMDHETKPGDFVIGEHESLEEEITDEPATISSPVISDNPMTEFLKSMGMESWILLTENEYQYIPEEYTGIRYATFRDTYFDKNNKLVSLMNKNKKIYVFTKNGLNQSLFRSRIDPEEIQSIHLLILLPIYKNGRLYQFYMILWKKRDQFQEIVQWIRQFYESISSNY